MPRRTVPAAKPTPGGIAAKIHSASKSASAPKDVLDKDDFRALVTLAELRRAEGTLPEQSPVRDLPTQKAVAEHYGVSPALLSQWVASYRWLVAAGLSDAERRHRMRSARELYHQKDRSGTSSGVRAYVAREVDEIAAASPSERAARWDALVERTRRQASDEELSEVEPLLGPSTVVRMRAAMRPLWREYDEWNTAFAKVVFSRDHAFQPVYLDVEDGLLEVVAEHLGNKAGADGAAASLYSAVRQTLVVDTSDGARSVFSYHRERLDEWWRETARSGVREDSPPPVIALLAVFARAAELMEKDVKFQANAYYPRLRELLSIGSGDAGRLQHSFRQHSEWFWRALNEWLAGLDGSLGLPTAEAIGHRYVGVPLSQALIRAADRQRFGKFFADADLEPGLRLSAEDMTVHLDRWIRAGNASVSIQKLWKAAGGKATVTDAAILALSQWDGTFQAEAHGRRSVQSPVITARIIKQVTGRRLRLGFALRGHSGGIDGLPRRWVVKSAAGEPALELEPINDRLLAPDFVGEIDPLTLLRGELDVRPTDHAGELNVSTRRPQPLVVLSYVDEAGLYVEVDRVRMLEPHLLLVNTNSKRFSGPHTIDFDHVLGEIAEAGFAKDDSLKGLPDGWRIYKNVTVVRLHTSRDPLLEPLKLAHQTSTLIIHGGLRLPGHAARWHADPPLTVKGSAVGATAMSLSITSTDSEEPLKSWHGDEGEVADEITASTASLDLEPGVYRAELTYRQGGKGHSSTTTFALCDSDEPRMRPLGEPVAYDLRTPFGALTATSSPDASKSIMVGDPIVAATQVAGLETPWWSLELIKYSAQKLAAPSAPDSCAVTGSHHWDIETHLRGMKKDRGECIKCGRTFLFSPTATKKKATTAAHTKKKATSTAAHTRAPLRHLDFGEPEVEVSGASLLDALTWLGAGTPAELARVVRQVYDSALTVDEIVRTLEMIGHISVVRSPEDFTIGRWEMSPRSLAGLEGGNWMAVGGWTRNDVAALGDVAADYGGTLESDDDDWLPRRVLHDLDESGACGVAEDLDAGLQPHAGRRLLAVLPPLSSVAPALSQVSAEGVFDAEWFDVNQARWVRVESIGQPGAYRTRQGYVSSYFVRLADDVVDAKLRRADSRVVKHLAASARPLVGYDAETRRLFVPLGADLPGLYGRAMSMFSGRPPARVDGQSLLAYSDVDEEAAIALVSLLKG